MATPFETLEAVIRALRERRTNSRRLLLHPRDYDALLSLTIADVVAAGFLPREAEIIVNEKFSDECLASLSSALGVEIERDLMTSGLFS